jgi:DNA-directed RNA polymerase subunit RPC12/RpoP
MATTNVACPWCGESTLVTIPRDKTLDSVRQYSSGKGFTFSSTTGNSTSSCSECGKKIAVYYS